MVLFSKEVKIKKAKVIPIKIRDVTVFQKYALANQQFITLAGVAYFWSFTYESLTIFTKK